jgi:endonuclease YncB( thermonuclease family)
MKLNRENTFSSFSTSGGSAGLALDWPQYSRGTYSEDQATAAGKGSGMFAGSFLEPWKYSLHSSGRPAASMH